MGSTFSGHHFGKLVMYSIKHSGLLNVRQLFTPSTLGSNDRIVSETGLSASGTLNVDFLLFYPIRIDNFPVVEKFIFNP